MTLSNTYVNLLVEKRNYTIYYLLHLNNNKKIDS